jgi:hypothetical protein
VFDNIELTKTLVALAQIKLLAEGTRNLGTAAVQRRLHEEFAGRRINADQLRRLQSEWNGVQDHLDLFISELAAIHGEMVDEAWAEKISRDMDGDRDAGRVCASCQHDLEQDADFRCVRCGTPT